MVHIGSVIQKRTEELGLGPTELGRRISKTKSNVRDIFLRKSIDTDLLLIISKALDYDFFSLYQKEQNKRLNDLEEDLALLKKQNRILTAVLDEKMNPSRDNSFMDIDTLRNIISLCEGSNVQLVYKNRLRVKEGEIITSAAKNEDQDLYDGEKRIAFRFTAKENFDDKSINALKNDDRNFKLKHSIVVKIEDLAFIHVLSVGSQNRIKALFPNIDQRVFEKI